MIWTPLPLHFPLWFMICHNSDSTLFRPIPNTKFGVYYSRLCFASFISSLLDLSEPTGSNASISLIYLDSRPLDPQPPTYDPSTHEPCPDSPGFPSACLKLDNTISDFYVLSAIQNHPPAPPPFQVLAPHHHAIPQSLSPSSVAPPNTQQIKPEGDNGGDLGESTIVHPLNPSIKDGQSVPVGAGELLLPPESSAQGSISREFSVTSDIIGSPDSRHSSVLPHCTPAPPTGAFMPSNH
ncbi:hypothetical protein BU17DRAFT_86553 [Hysterangium stoloniferum]|nr:hypothetical protein BU17DRAFT_86553 [Hysterangium stoloniferum]